MAATVTPGTTIFSVGNTRSTTSSVVGDSSYPTGGYPITARQLGLNRVRRAHAWVRVASAAAATSVDADTQSDGSILLKLNTATAEVANAVNCSGLTIVVRADGDA